MRNCRIFHSRALTRRTNFKFMCLSAYWQKKGVLANHDGDGSDTKQKVNEQNSGCARAFWILVHFFSSFRLCRPLPNNYVKWPSSMYFGEREPQWLIFGIFFWNWTLSVHVKPEHVFRPISLLNTFTALRHSKVKYKFVLLQDVVPAVAVVTAKTP